MDSDNLVLQRMQSLRAVWEQAGDRRFLFVDCYALMTNNVLAAIASQEFKDNAWVNALLDRFAEYYFIALEAYEHEQPAPVVWQIAFNASRQPRSHVLQDLLLGINAHINYDLAFAISDLLRPEWSALAAEQRADRYHDHCHINAIINRTINLVQDQVAARYDPLLGLADKALGPLDEWVTGLFIADWREEVWQHALALVEAGEEAQRLGVARKISDHSIQRARTFLGEEGLAGLITLI